MLHRAVKDADPGAAVDLGGAPYALPASPPSSPERQFFDVLLRDGRDFFDLFDLRLYGDASRIPADIETTREDDARVRLREAAGGRRVQRPMAEPVPGGDRSHGAG